MEMNESLPNLDDGNYDQGDRDCEDEKFIHQTEEDDVVLEVQNQKIPSLGSVKLSLYKIVVAREALVQNV